MGKYRGVPAAEAYALAGENIPRCECHDQPKVWYCDGTRKKGGSWRCRMKSRERAARYGRNHPERKKDQFRKWASENTEHLRVKKALYSADRKAKGLCVHCNRGPAISETSCWDCLTRKQIDSMFSNALR